MLLVHDQHLRWKISMPRPFLCARLTSLKHCKVEFGLLIIMSHNCDAISYSCDFAVKEVSKIQHIFQVRAVAEEVPR